MSMRTRLRELNRRMSITSLFKIVWLILTAVLIISSCSSPMASVPPVITVGGNTTFTPLVQMSETEELNADCPLPRKLPKVGEVYAIAVSPNGEQIAVSTETKLTLYRTGNFDVLWSQDVSNDIVLQQVVFSPTGGIVASIVQNSAYLWSVNAGELISTFTPEKGTRLVEMSFSPDGTMFAYSTNTSSAVELTIWNLQAKKEIQRISNTLGGLMWIPGGKQIAMYSGVTMQVWDIETGALLKTIKRSPQMVGGGCPEKTFCGTDVVVDSNGAFHIAEDFYQQVNILDMETLEEKQTFQIPTNIVSLAWSPNGEVLALGGENGTVFLWDAARQSIKCTLDAGSGHIIALKWSSDGHTVLSADANNVITAWQMGSQ